MNIAPLVIPLPDGYEAKLIFRQYESDGDWICQMSHEVMFDLQTLLEGGNVVDTVQ